MSAGTNAGWNYGPYPDPAAAFNYLISNMEDFRTRFREVQYQDLFWREVIPEGSIDTGINPGATAWSYPILDWRGQGAFRAKYQKNIPTVTLTSGKSNIPLALGAVSAIMDTEEIRNVLFGVQLDLRSRFPEIMRRACDLHVEGATMYGDADLNFVPFLDYPGIPEMVAPDGASGNSEWTDKTALEIIADLNLGIATVWMNTRYRNLPNTIFLPPSAYAEIIGMPSSDLTVKTTLEFFMDSNLYTSQRGQPLRLVPLPYLEDAGEGGSRRIIFADINEETISLAFPMPFNLLQPQFNAYDIQLFAEYKFGPVHIPYPLAFFYMDGI